MKNRIVSALTLVVFFLTLLAPFKALGQEVETRNSFGCHGRHEGGYLLDSSGYPGPSRHAIIELREGEAAVVELYNARHAENGWPMYQLVPIQHNESGNGRFRIHSMHIYSFYYLTRVTGCTYEEMMWIEARIATGVFRNSHSDRLSASWLLPSADHGPVRPEIPMMNLPAYPDPIHACRPLDWQDIGIGEKVTAKWWEVEYRSSSAFGNYEGSTIVGPARIREFVGQCDGQRWWEHFAFERMLRQESNPWQSPSIGVEFNPWQFVKPGHRAFLPTVGWRVCPYGFVHTSDDRCITGR